MLAQAAARAAEARSGAAGAAEKAKTVERVNHAMSYNHRIVKSLFNPRQRRGSASGRASKDAALAGAKWDIFFKKTLKTLVFSYFRAAKRSKICVISQILGHPRGSNVPSSVWAPGGWQEGNLTEIKPIVLSFREAKRSKNMWVVRIFCAMGLSVATSLEKIKNQPPSPSLQP